MILADTSVWIDHLRVGDPDLVRHLSVDEILGHPLVTAEIALGSLRARDTVRSLLDGLPQAPTATTTEVRRLIERRGLHARGLGYVDASLLAACLLRPGTTFWTRDRRLDSAARDLGISPFGTED